MPAALGVSVRRGLALNFVSVRRRAGDASGALIELVRERGGGDGGGRVLANVEYNQLEPLLRAASAGASGDEPDPATGWSPYPGNCNQLVVALRPCAAAGRRTTRASGLAARMNIDITPLQDGAQSCHTTAVATSV